MVHRLRQSGDGCQAFLCEVEALTHPSNDFGEDGEVVRLGGSQWIRFEEGNDRRDQISLCADPIAVEIFPVIVVPAIAADRTTPEEVLQSVQDRHAPRSLNDRELRLDLPTEATRSVPEDRNAEAPFAVDEADDPLHVHWPFLLIVRT